MVSDLCVVKVNRKTWQERDTRAMPFKEWLPTSELDSNTKQIASAIFTVVSEVGLIVPYIDIILDGVLFTWDNDSETQRHLLYIFVQPGKSIRYQVARTPVIQGDYAWQYITDSDELVARCKLIARYVGGVPDETKV